VPEPTTTTSELSSAEQAALAARLGPEMFTRRMAVQHQIEVDPESDEAGPINVQRMVRRMRILSGFLHTVGVAQWGRRNMLAVRREENTLRLRGLPSQFRGRRLLHLADLHADIDAGIIPSVIRAIGDWEYDAVVLTGDYRAHTRHEWGTALNLCRDLANTLRPAVPKFAVLGNHDALEMVPGLEALGWRVLLNEAASWRLGGAELWIGGVDDEHTYGTADVTRVRSAIPVGACALLLSHTPSTYAEAAAAGFAGMLCGHTHGGQMCLPGRIALLNNAHAPRFVLSGSWNFKGMNGYTSRGAGACRVPARFFCPPEVTRHTLEAP